MCLKISIVTCTKSDSKLKYHLEKKKKNFSEKTQKLSHLFDFSLKKIGLQRVAEMPLMLQLVLHSNREHRNQLKSQLGMRISIV